MFILEESFSPRLLYSFTAESFAVTEFTHMQEQTDLLRLLATRWQGQEEEKEGDATVDETRCQLEHSLEESPREKVSLLNDCRIRRTHEDEVVLAEVQRKCSQSCFVRVKEAFQNLRQQMKTVRQLEGELQLSRKISDSLLQFKEENDQLRVQLERALSAVADKQQQRDKLRVLEERNMNKEASVLKNEKNLLMKEKRINEMRKKAQGILDSVTREVSGVTKEIHLFLACWKDINRGGSMVKLDGLQQRAEAIVRLWEEFEASLKSKLQ